MASTDNPEWDALYARLLPLAGTVPCCGLNCIVPGNVDASHICVVCKALCCGICRKRNADGSDLDNLRKFVVCTRHDASPTADPSAVAAATGAPPEEGGEDDDDNSLDRAIAAKNLSAAMAATPSLPEMPDVLAGAAEPAPKKGKGKGKGKGGKVPRGKAYTPTEYLYLAKAYVKNSKDSIRGTSKKTATFWADVHETYGQLVNTHNAHWEKMRGDQFDRLPERNKKSLQDQWSGRIQPAMNKWVGVVHSNPPKSGELKDDKLMDIYYSRMRALYEERMEGASGNTPKRFHDFMDVYKWIQNEPKFEAIFPTGDYDDDGDGGEGSQKKKQRAPKSIKRPQGRDKTKQNLAKERLVEDMSEKITKEVAAVVGSEKDSGEASGRWGVIEEGIKSMGAATSQMLNNQIMGQAATPERKRYFGAMQDKVMEETELKRRSMELQKRKLDYDEKKLELDEKKL